MKTTFAIGCLIQWYEVEIVHEYISTLYAAIRQYSREDVNIDIVVNTGQTLEHCTADLQGIIDKIYRAIHQDINLSTHLRVRWINDSEYTIASYRREFNNEWCDKVDVLVWGETDMLVPKDMFVLLESLHVSQSRNTPKYIATFGICKMWDESWKPLEHVEFTNKPFIENDYVNWWSLKYTMSAEEMHKFNDAVEIPEVRVLPNHKFNGCGLVISSEVIKAGVNIPKSIFFVHEDTAFMVMIGKILGNIPQYHISNILLVHNRNHPRKRMYVQGETGGTLNEKRRSNDWYVKANRYSEQNCYNISNPNYKSLTWADVYDTNKTI